VQTATLAGPVKILGAAGEDIIGGVKGVLSDSAAQKEPFFSFSGLQYSLQPSDVIGPEIYVLLHRGDDLPEASLTVKKSGQLLLPYLNDAPLDDGAWLLLSIRRTIEFSGVREWFDTAKAFRLRLRSTLDDFNSGVITKDDALNHLKPGGSGNQTVFDDYSKLRGVISNDGVLTEAEAAVQITGLSESLNGARKSIEAGRAQTFMKDLSQVHVSLISGNPDPALQESLSQHLYAVNSLRSEFLPLKLRMSKKERTMNVSALLKQAPSFKKSLGRAFL
jgi:hypothetical protein